MLMTQCIEAYASPHVGENALPCAFSFKNIARVCPPTQNPMIQQLSPFLPFFLVVVLFSTIREKKLQINYLLDIIPDTSSHIPFQPS